MSWEDVPLGDVCLPVEKVDPVQTGRESVRYVDIGSVDGSRHTLLEVASVDAKEAPSRCRQVVHRGDTVFSTVRPYLEKVAYIDESLDREFASTGFAVLRPGNRIDSRFLYYFSISKQMFDQVLPHQRGVSYPAVLEKVVRSALIPVPPLGEQRRIVDLLEDHLSRLDAAARSLEDAAARLVGLRERAVGDVLTGVAVPGQHGPSALADAGTSDGDLPTLPFGWHWARLDDVADVVGGVTKDAKKQSNPSFIEVPYLRVANVQRGMLKLDEITTIRVAPTKAAALRLEAGDVLLNEGGDRDKLARGWVWEGQIEGCIHQNHVFRARLRDDRLNPYFLSWTANTIGGRWAERNGKQSVNLASISLSMIRKMPVIVPPAGEADRAIAHLDQVTTAIKGVEVAIDTQVRRNAALRRSLLAAAFSGQLTGHRDGVSALGRMIGA